MVTEWHHPPPNEHRQQTGYVPAWRVLLCKAVVFFVIPDSFTTDIVCGIIDPRFRQG
jgi:hypothetical protein